MNLPETMFDGPAERKTTKLCKGDTFDAGQLESIVSEAASTL